MAIIPRAPLVNREAPDNTMQPRVSPDAFSGQARALTEFGETLSVIGAERLEEYRQAEDATYIANAGANVEEKLMKIQTNAKKQMAVDGRGYMKNVMSQADAVFQEAIDGAPRQRSRMALYTNYTNARTQLMEQSFKAEAAARTSFYANQIEASHDKDINLARINPEKADEIIARNSSNGAIASVYGNKTGEVNSNFARRVREAALTGRIDKEPEKVLEEIKAGKYVELLKPGQQEKMLRMSEAGVEDQKRQKAAEARALEQAKAEQAKIVKAQLDLAITTGSAGLKEIEAQKDNLSPIDYYGLQKQLYMKGEKEAKEAEVFQGIAKNISDGRPVSADYTPGQVDDFYRGVLKSQAQQAAEGAQVDGTPTPLSFEQKASLVNTIGAPVKSFQAELEHGVLYSTDADQIKSMVNSYRYLEQNNAATLKGFDSTAGKVASATDFYMTQANLSPQDAIKKARDKILNEDNLDRKALVNNYSLVEQFKGDELKERFIESMNINTGFFSSNVAIPASATIKFQELLRDNYVQTNGDETLALNLTARQMKQTYGTSAIQGEEKFMFAPPEKFVPNANIGYWLKNSYAKDVQGLAELSKQVPDSIYKYELPSNAPKLDTDRETFIEKDLQGSKPPVLVINGKEREIFFNSDDMTRSSPNGGVDYHLYYYDDEGFQQLLIDPVTRSPARWSPPSFQDVAPVGTAGVTLEQAQNNLLKERKKAAKGNMLKQIQIENRAFSPDN